MINVDLDAVREMAADLQLVNQKLAAYDSFVIAEEQEIALAAMIDYDRVAFLKGRQIGLSTICCLYDLAFAVCNPGLNVAIIADLEEKAIDLLAKIIDWCHQLGIELITENATRIKLVNGAQIYAKSSISRADEKQSRTGRSVSFAHVHLTELAFMVDDVSMFAAVTATLFPGAKIVVESTASPAQNLYRKLWDDKENGWHKVFFPLEQHAAYTADPANIDDEQWADAQARFGFTSRPHAAWWLGKLKTDFLGDHHACLREFPVLEHHAWSMAEGRWITRYVPALDYVEDGHWTLLSELAKIDEPVVFGVDTSKGVGKDASSIAIVGQRTGALHACYRNNKIDLASFAQLVLATAAEWKPVAIVIESNGVGEAVYHMVACSSWSVINQDSDVKSGEKHLRMRMVANRIESGAIPCPPVLVEELQHSVISKKGDWEGTDDLLNAISFAEKYRIANPWVAPVITPDLRRVFVPLSARKKKRYCQ